MKNDNNVLQGEVTWFDAGKGYGFIKDDNGDDHFCHYTEIVSSGYRTLTQGTGLSFQSDPATMTGSKRLT